MIFRDSEIQSPGRGQDPEIQRSRVPQGVRFRASEIQSPARGDAMVKVHNQMKVRGDPDEEAPW